jgi:F420-non-reducing hydrogenase iron-sulfur subunit
MDFTPAIVAFCCENSAYRAADLAGTKQEGYPSNVKLCRLPCSGKLEIIHILKAFEEGADGVFVFACHPDSCKFLLGNVRAGKRIDHTNTLLEKIGIEKERLRFFNLSELEWTTFLDLIRQGNESIKSLGPSPAKVRSTVIPANAGIQKS